MQISIIVRLIATALMLVFTGSAGAVLIVDQENFGGNNTSGSLSNSLSTFGRAQTFTVGVAGIFDSIDVQLRGGATSARVIATAAGAPIGGSAGSTVLANSSGVSNVGDIYTFDLSAAGLAVNVGDILAIELFGTGPWVGTSSNPYAGGADYFFNNVSFPNWTIQPDVDLNFRTYVDVVGVPEPTTLALFGLGVLGLRFNSRKRDI